VTNGLGVSPSSTHIPRYNGGVVLNPYRLVFLPYCVIDWLDNAQYT